MTTEEGDKQLNNTQHSTSDTWYPKINTEDIDEPSADFGDRPIFPNTPEHYQSRQVDLNDYYASISASIDSNAMFWPENCFPFPMPYPEFQGGFPMYPNYPNFPGYDQYNIQSQSTASIERMLDLPILNVPSMEKQRTFSSSTACGSSSCEDSPTVAEHTNKDGQKVYRLKFSFASSVGSIGHSTGRCYPCAFYFQRGCTKGVDCMYCHMCSIDELHRRRRLKEFEYNHLQQVNMHIDKQTAEAEAAARGLINV